MELADSSTPVRLHRRRHNRLGGDILAGLTVAAVELPQAFGYALLAGVPPQYGVFTSVIQGVLAAAAGGSAHVVSGPTNTQSLLVISAITRMVDPADRPEMYLQLVFALTFLKGLLQILMAMLRFGDLVRFVSRSVVVGLSAGAGVLIFAGQLPHLLGLSTARQAGDWPGVIGVIQQLLRSGMPINPAAVGIGAGAIVLIVALRAVSRLVPGSLFAVALATVVVALVSWSVPPPTLGMVPVAWPRLVFPWPAIGDVDALLAAAAALATLGIIETTAIGRTLAPGDAAPIDPNREALAQGCANFLSSFLQCIPGSASFTRSALARDAGGASRAAAIASALAVGLFFVLLADLVRWVPLSAIAAVLIVISMGLIDWRYALRICRTSWSDSIVCAVTFLATISLPLEYAVFVGIVVNIALYLRSAARLQINEMVQTAGGPFLERPLHDRSGASLVVFLQLEGQLFFGVADELQQRLNGLVHSDARVVLLRLKRTHSIDATVLHVLESFIRKMQACHHHVLLCGVRPEIESTLRAYGLIELLGRENLFVATIGVWSSAKQALARAKELIGRSIDDTRIDTREDELEYQI